MDIEQGGRGRGHLDREKHSCPGTYVEHGDVDPGLDNRCPIATFAIADAAFDARKLRDPDLGPFQAGEIESDQRHDQGHQRDPQACHEEEA